MAGERWRGLDPASAAWKRRRRLTRADSGSGGGGYLTASSSPCNVSAERVDAGRTSGATDSDAEGENSQSPLRHARIRQTRRQRSGPELTAVESLGPPQQPPPEPTSQKQTALPPVTPVAATTAATAEQPPDMQGALHPALDSQVAAGVLADSLRRDFQPLSCQPGRNTGNKAANGHAADAEATCTQPGRTLSQDPARNGHLSPPLPVSPTLFVRPDTPDSPTAVPTGRVAAGTPGVGAKPKRLKLSQAGTPAARPFATGRTPLSSLRSPQLNGDAAATLAAGSKPDTPTMLGGGQPSIATAGILGTPMGGQQCRRSSMFTPAASHLTAGSECRSAQPGPESLAKVVLAHSQSVPWTFGVAGNKTYSWSSLQNLSMLCAGAGWSKRFPGCNKGQPS